MKISCSKIQKLEISEGIRVEFKTSIFFSAGNVCQAEVIAKTICAFINTEGGDLYLGVRDDGVVVGIESDLQAMSRNDRVTEIIGPYASDRGYRYKANVDNYYLKIQKVVEAYIGKDALRFLGDVEVVDLDGLVHLRIPVSAAPHGEFVRFRCASSRGTEIFIRSPGSNRLLTDLDRDNFVIRKTRATDDENEKLIDVIKGLMGRQGDDLKRILTEAFAEAENANKQDSVPEDSATQSLLKRIQDAIAQTSSERKITLHHADFHAELDPEVSTLEVMDEFQEKDGDAYMYSRMILSRSSPCFSSLPYLRSKKNGFYEKIADVDFELQFIEWLVERLTLSQEEAAVVESLQRKISISDLKRNHTRNLQAFLWAEAVDILRQEKFDEVSELHFKNVFLLRANTSDTWACYGDNLFQITGMRFVKRKLRDDCPDSTEGMDYWTEAKLVGYA